MCGYHRRLTLCYHCKRSVKATDLCASRLFPCCNNAPWQCLVVSLLNGATFARSGLLAVVVDSEEPASVGASGGAGVVVLEDWLWSLMVEMWGCHWLQILILIHLHWERQLSPSQRLVPQCIFLTNVASFYNDNNQISNAKNRRRIIVWTTAFINRIPDVLFSFLNLRDFTNINPTNLMKLELIYR